MVLMLDHLIGGLQTFLADEPKLILSILSILAAGYFLFLLKTQSYSPSRRAVAIFAHLLFLTLPLILLALSLNCTGLQLACIVTFSQLALVFLPIELLLSLFGGLFLIPALQAKKALPLGGRHQRFVSGFQRKLGIRETVLYSVDTGKPLAFSCQGLKNSIFISVGMLELLTPKEIEAVLLHELEHLRRGASLLKVSLGTLKLAPTSFGQSFSHHLNAEETAADEFAIKTQKTSRFLEGARKKVSF